MAHSTIHRRILVGFCLLFGITAHAQYNWDIGFSAGASNYLGDIGGSFLTRRDFVADMKVSQTKATAGGFFRYKLDPNWSVKTSLTWARIAGDDKLTTNPARNARNLNFRNDLVELASVLQFTFYDINDLGRSFRYQDNFRAYFGLGAGLIYHNPKAYYNGEYVALRPLETENVGYSKVAAVIPVTGGFYFTFNKQFRVGLDISWRTTFTDYLDDVSTNYADPAALGSDLAIELANRTDELDNISPAFAENFTPGSKRGDNGHNDSYLTSSLEVSWAFRTRSDFEKAHYPWLHRKRGNKPSKYNGMPGGRRTGYRIRGGKLVRIIRPKW